MSVDFSQVEGVLVLCPGCRAEVPASEGPADPERPFRCRKCRMAMNEFAQRHLEAQESEVSKRGKRKQPNSNVQNQPVAVGDSGEGD